MKLRDLSARESLRLNKKFIKFHEKWIKGLKIVTTAELKKCRKAFMKQHNLE